MRYFLIVLGIFTAELGIKNRVEKNGEQGKEKTVAGGLLLLKKYHNDGAFLNFGQKRKIWVAVWSVLLTAVLSILFVLSFGTHGGKALKTGLSLLLGGAFSNTYDRLKRSYVVDYFSFGVKWKPLRNIVFNLSDFCIIIGSLVAVLSAQ